MADRELVVKISEKTINEIKDNAMFAKSIADKIKWDVTSAIVNGIPLPKGHGRLIDADRTKEAIYEGFEGIQFYDGTGFDIYQDSIKCIDCVPTIIEADKAESEVRDGK